MSSNEVFGASFEAKFKAKAIWNEVLEKMEKRLAG
jgi:hypothetical protein